MLTQRVTVAQFLVLAWCAYLAVQWGDPYDETEHAHAAWLIGEQGQRPHQDFFQHHQPTLWHVLSLYYLFGRTGPEVLYWGRGLVVASAFVSYVGMWALARRTALNRGVADGEGS